MADQYRITKHTGSTATSSHSGTLLYPIFADSPIVLAIFRFFPCAKPLI
jgi:hypothetical protein